MTPRSNKYDHVVMGPHPNDASCLRCGETLNIGKPVALTVFCAALAAFGKAHMICPAAAQEQGASPR